MQNDFLVVNLEEKYALFQEQWRPKIIAQMNDYHFKLVKVQGDFVWHRHADTDEVFIVQEGRLRIDLRERPPVWLNAGEMYVVPKGVEHKPYAEHEVKLLLVEPQGVLNTGEASSERTAPVDDWI
ncbi:cupin [Chromobacterium sp. LK11]|nr:cupin [Chromobacterium sp. LK11]